MKKDEKVIFRGSSKRKSDCNKSLNMSGIHEVRVG